MFTREELTELVSTKVNEKNFLTFSKLLSLQDSNLYREVINMIFKNTISIWELEELPIIDDIEIRKFLSLRYARDNLFFGSTSSSYNSDFKVREYLYNDESPAFLKLKQLNDFESINGVYVHKKISSLTLAVDSYSSVNEARTDFNTKVLPELKRIIGSDEDVSNIITEIRNYCNSIPNQEEREIVNKIFESLFCFLDFNIFFTDSKLFDLAVNTYTDFSFISQMFSDMNEFINTRIDVDEFRKSFNELTFVVANNKAPLDMAYLQTLKTTLSDKSTFDINISSVSITQILFLNLLYRYIVKHTNTTDIFDIEPHIIKLLEGLEKIKNVLFLLLDSLLIKYMRVYIV